MGEARDPKSIVRDARHRMEKAVDVFEDEIKQLRTGRATPAILEPVKVEYYGQKMPLNQLATITAPEPRLLVVQPWDKSIMKDIEDAIRNADLGLNPSNDGNVVRVPIPPLTVERRQELVKVLHKMTEEARVAVRNVRRDALHHLQSLKKEKAISEDEEKHYEKEIQKLTDEFIDKINQISREKEKEILEE